jgi:hypothetical protein
MTVISVTSTISLMTVFTIALMITMFMMTMIAVVSMFDYSVPVMSIIELMTAKSGMSIVTSVVDPKLFFPEPNSDTAEALISDPVLTIIRIRDLIRIVCEKYIKFTLFFFKA